MNRRPLLAALAAVAGPLALAAVAAPASADSIAYVKAHNIWLMAPDGSRQHQVTRDGSAREPYGSPSQDTRGRIAVTKGPEIRVLEQNGTQVARFTPADLKDTIGHSTAGWPASVALTPDGRRIAYVMTSVGCDPTAPCGARGSIGIVAADGRGPSTRPGEYGGMNPHWITSSRLLWNGGYGSHTRVYDLGAGVESWNWFDDSDIHTESLASTDLSDPAVSADGRYAAAIRGYGDTTHVIWYRVNGSILSGDDPGAPTELCETNADPRAADPTLAPDGSGLAVGDVDGIQVKRNLDDCDDIRLVAAGGSQPDWGPANVAPKPLKKAKAKRKVKR